MSGSTVFVLEVLRFRLGYGLGTVVLASVFLFRRKTPVSEQNAEGDIEVRLRRKFSPNFSFVAVPEETRHRRYSFITNAALQLHDQLSMAMPIDGSPEWLTIRTH